MDHLAELPPPLVEDEPQQPIKRLWSLRESRDFRHFDDKSVVDARHERNARPSRDGYVAGAAKVHSRSSGEYRRTDENFDEETRAAPAPTRQGLAEACRLSTEAFRRCKAKT